MPEPGTPHLLLPLLSALALLLTTGVAAGLHLSARRNEFSTPWTILLSQLAAASPWRAVDAGWIALALAGAQLIRSRLPPATLLDVLAFQGALIASIGWRMRGKPRPFGAVASARIVLPQATVRWLAILPVLWFLSFTWNILLSAWGHAPDLQEAIHVFLAADNLWTRIQFVFFAVVLAPIAEEALFRGLLLPLLVRRLGPGLGVALVAVGFAALHGDIGSFPGLAVLAVALSLAYARTGTILVPMAMHALFNAANLALLTAMVRAGVVR